MSLVLLAISLSIALGVLAFRFAVFALPVMAGIAAFLQVHEGGSGFGLSVLAGLAGAAASVAFVIAILGFARNSFLRLGALGLFAVPAAVAGYALAHDGRVPRTPWTGAALRSDQHDLGGLQPAARSPPG